MIEALKNDDIINQLGGRFKLTALIQRRMGQLLRGARPMIDEEGLTLMELVVREITEGKIKPKSIAEEPDLDDEI